MLISVNSSIGSIVHLYRENKIVHLYTKSNTRWNEDLYI